MRPRIINGNIDKNWKLFPYVAFITWRFNTTTRFLCSGSLIGPSHILTAAHMSPRSWYARAARAWRCVPALPTKCTWCPPADPPTPNPLCSRVQCLEAEGRHAQPDNLGINLRGVWYPAASVHVHSGERAGASAWGMSCTQVVLRQTHNQGSRLGLGRHVGWTPAGLLCECCTLTVPPFSLTCRTAPALKHVYRLEQFRRARGGAFQ